jgi:hypothetical protein
MELIVDLTITKTGPFVGFPWFLFIDSVSLELSLYGCDHHPKLHLQSRRICHGTSGTSLLCIVRCTHSLCSWELELSLGLLTDLRTVPWP